MTTTSNTSHRNRRALVALAIVAVGALWFAGTIHDRLVWKLTLRMDAPSESLLEEVLGARGDTDVALAEIWRAGTTPGRLFVLERLNRSWASEPALVEKLAPLVQEAVWDIDLEVREQALNLLASQKYPDLKSILYGQLIDADPAIRVLALQHLLPIADSRDVAAGAKMLEDADPRVVVCAGTLLRRVTGRDFGLRFSQAIPRFEPIGDEPLTPPDWDSIRTERDAWLVWWREHESEFPARREAMRDRKRTEKRPRTDFMLADAAGKTVRLSRFRGKTVLLSFWNPDAQSSPDDEHILTKVVRGHQNRLAVLFIALNSTLRDEDGCADHEQGVSHDNPGEGHNHDGEPRWEPTGPRPGRALHPTTIRRTVADHPVLWDPNSSLAKRFNVTRSPAYIVLDAQGDVVRRFDGPREPQALRAMLLATDARDQQGTPSPP